MNSITLNSSFWVKVGQIFLNLFLGDNSVMVGSEAYIVRSHVYFFVQGSTILFQWSVAAVLQYAFVETFTAKFKILEVIWELQYVLLHRHNISVNLNSSLKRPDSLLLCCFCSSQHVRGKKFATASAMKLSIQSFDRNLYHSALISSLIQSSSSFSAKAR